MKKAINLSIALLAGLITIGAWGENNSPGSFPLANVFAGSTPCDSLIKVLLGIEADATCDFIKWELRLHQTQTTSNAFELNILYGESQPNTNGFINGGTRIETTGIYNTLQGMDGYPQVKVLQLNAKRFLSPVLLVEMDNNILHFIDHNKKFIVGNGGWGYVLNRIE